MSKKTLGRRIAATQNTADVASADARQVGDRVDAVKAESAAARRLILEVAPGEAQGGFEFGSEALPQATQVRLDDLVRPIVADARSVKRDFFRASDGGGCIEIYSVGKSCI